MYISEQERKLISEVSSVMKNYRYCWNV